MQHNSSTIYIAIIELRSYFIYCGSHLDILPIGENHSMIMGNKPVNTQYCKRKEFCSQNLFRGSCKKSAYPEIA